MSSKQAIFANGEFYHIFNRGVEKRTTFLNNRDYQRFLQTLKYYQLKNPPSRFSTKDRQILNNKAKDDSLLVEIIAFCLMPNHFHLLIRQIGDGGITKFMSKLLNSYTKYFNTKHNRIGPLYQGIFKAVRVEGDEQLLHLSRYIHLNPLIDYLVKDLASYRYSSYPQFLGKEKGFCQTQYVLNSFNDPSAYQQFVLDQESYGREIKFIERALLEDYR